MEAAAKACLLRTLEKLREIEFRLLKDQLDVVCRRESSERTPWEEFRNATRKELAHHLISCYGVDRGVEVAVEALKMITLDTLAKDLVDFQRAEKHFVEQNQDELIQRVSKVPEVLNRLVGVALDDGQYEDIMSEPTDALRMQKLYELVPSWNKLCKDGLYRALEETNGLLIAELNGGHFVERHKTELIHRVSGVDNILQQLLHSVLNPEQYEAIKAESTEGQKMKKLCELLPSWDRQSKDQFYEALKMTNRSLILELEEHLVEKHKEELIRRVSKVQHVMGALKSQLDPYQYERIMAAGTDRQKMKLLYELVPSWDRENKDRLLQIIMETNAELLREIGGRHFVERHQQELIRQVSGIDVVLFQLLGFALNHDEYCHIMAEETDARKTKKLLELALSWNRRKKDWLYRELIRTNGPLIAALEGASEQGEPVASASDEEHFIEKHQEELIRRVVGVDIIFVHLQWNNIITREQIREMKGPNQQQMRKLYELVPSWITIDKDEMKRILMKTNRRLIEQLAEGHFLDRHREELTENLKDIPLRKLHGLLLDEKQYQTLVNCTTEKMKMQGLFQIEHTWKRPQKDQLYRVLAETNRDVIEMLEEEHFIETHQVELIHRVSSADAVLRRLRDRCSVILTGSDQQKMEQLYELVPGWDRKRKDHLHTVLKKTHGPLIAELEEGHFVERHKKELTQRGTGAKKVGKQLLQVTICHRLYVEILSKPTDKEKMETLYNVVPGWNGEWKDRLYQALRETNEHLIKELEGRKSSKEGMIPDPLAENKCYLCEKEEDFPEVQPDVVPDVSGKQKMYSIHLPKAGNVRCSVTKFKFEMRTAGTVKYTYCPWNEHLNKVEMQDWMMAGPLFDIQADAAGEVAAVHLPLIMCLKEAKVDMSQMKIAHFIDGVMILETPSRVSPFHVVLENPKFSLLGAIYKCICNLFNFIPIHSVVQLYQRNRPTILHLYVIPNDSYYIQAVKDEEEKYHSLPVQKHPQTDEPLYFGSHYVVSSSADLRINPKELKFSYQKSGELLPFVEVYLRKKERVYLSLKKKDGLCSVWDIWLEPEEVLIPEDQHVSVMGTREAARAASIKLLKTNRDHLEGILENLEKQEMKKFKVKLNEFPVKWNFKNIPRGELEDADALDLSAKLIEYYTEDYAVEVAIQVLNAVNLKHQANRLSSDVGTDYSDLKQEDKIQQEPEQEEKHLAEERSQALKNFLSKLKLQKQKDKGLSLKEVLEISSGSLKECTLHTLGDLPLQFLRRVFALNITARDTALEQATLDGQGRKIKGKEKMIDEGIVFTNELAERISVNPLDVLCAVLLCSDSCLQQGIFSKMSMCQFALPLLLPPLETPKCTLMLWAMRDIVKRWRPHSLAESRGFREESLVMTSMPTISFVRMGNLGLSKSKLLNLFLSPSQHHHNFFIHQDMESGNVPREIADGLVEMAWYFPRGQKSSDLFPEPLAVANLRGDVEHHWVQFSFLIEASSAVFIFAKTIGKREYIHLSSLKAFSTQCYFILDCDDRQLNESLDVLKKLIPGFHFNESHILSKAAMKNEAEFVGKLQTTVGRLFSAETHPRRVSVEEMAATAHKVTIQVDENSKECQNALQCAQKITQGIKDVALYKKDMLKLQGNLWKSLTKVEKELCRMKRQGDTLSEKYKSELNGRLLELRKQQDECNLSPGLVDFIDAIKHLSCTEKQYFLKWMRLILNQITRGNLSRLRAEYKEKSKTLRDDHTKMLEADRQISSCSLEVEHFMRKLGQTYEAECSRLKEGKLAETQRQFACFPSIAANLLLEGFPLELIDGDAYSIPLQWITDVLTELHNQLGGRSKMVVITVLGVQSTGKSTLLNTMFGLQFAVSSGQSTRGAFMTLLNVGETMTQELGCDFILVIDTEGLKVPEFTTLEESYQPDNELATLVIGLSDITIVNMAMENEIKDLLQIVTHAFLRMEMVGQKPNCHFVHQNVSDVSAHDKSMRDRKRLLEQLNAMTQAAAKRENMDRDIKFSDIMDYDPELHNWYIPGLWHGVPPMAPVNRGYSEKVFELKKYLFECIRYRSYKRTPKNIPDFIEWVKSLWNAVEHENFLFSF